MPGVARRGIDRASETMIGLRGWVCGWSGSGMQRGGERGGDLDGGDDDPHPEHARTTGRRRRPSAERDKAVEKRGSRGGRVGVTYKYFGAPDGATAARVPISMRPEELGGDELGQGMYTKVKPETM